MRFAQVAPRTGSHFDAVVPGSFPDVGKCLFPLLVGDVLDLVKASEGVADVAGVGERFLALLRDRPVCGSPRRGRLNGETTSRA